MNMKKLFLTGVTALFLATGAAHAYPPRYYDCGRAFLKVQAGKGTAPSGRRVFPRTFTIQENWEKEDRENLPELGSLVLRCTKFEKCWFNDKLCRKMSDEEGKKEFPDE